MKLTGLGVVLVLVAILVASGSSIAGSSGDDQKAIADLNLKALKAFDQKDDVTLAKIEAADFDILSDRGLLAKKDHIAGVQADKANAFAIDRTIADQKIRVYGNTAVVTELDHAGASGGGSSSSYQSTSVWVKNGGAWQIVHLHYTKVE